MLWSSDNRTRKKTWEKLYCQIYLEVTRYPTYGGMFQLKHWQGSKCNMFLRDCFSPSHSCVQWVIDSKQSAEYCSTAHKKCDEIWTWHENTQLRDVEMRLKRNFDKIKLKVDAYCWSLALLEVVVRLRENEWQATLGQKLSPDIWWSQIWSQCFCLERSHPV